MAEEENSGVPLKYVTAMGSIRRHREWCVEVAVGEDGVYVRDSKNCGSVSALKFTDAEWQVFIDGVKNGEFDLPDARNEAALSALGPLAAAA